MRSLYCRHLACLFANSRLELLFFVVLCLAIAAFVCVSILGLVDCVFWLWHLLCCIAPLICTQAVVTHLLRSAGLTHCLMLCILPVWLFFRPAGSRLHGFTYCPTADLLALIAVPLSIWSLCLLSRCQCLTIGQDSRHTRS